MGRTGSAHLPLHAGKAPRWLFSRMVRLSREISIFLVAESAARRCCAACPTLLVPGVRLRARLRLALERVTTTVCGALKEGLRGLDTSSGSSWRAARARRRARRRPRSRRLRAHRSRSRAARLREPHAAKVDNAAVQDGYQLYHHSFFFTAAGDWCVVQQGMNDDNGMARRYHWLSEGSRASQRATRRDLLRARPRR